MKQDRSFLTLSNKKRKNATLKIKYEIGRDLFISDNKVSSYPFGAWVTNCWTKSTKIYKIILIFDRFRLTDLFKLATL